MEGLVLASLVQPADGKFDVVDNFFYLGDCICPGGRCELATIKRCHSTWGKFRELLPLITLYLYTHVVKYIAVVSEERCLIH